MKVNIFFDEESVPDVISVPERIENIGIIQSEFFKWMFNKDNDHKYWVYVNGEKRYCNYGTSAFVEWLNEYILRDSKDKAKIEELAYTSYCDKDAYLNF